MKTRRMTGHRSFRIVLDVPRTMGRPGYKTAHHSGSMDVGASEVDPCIRAIEATLSNYPKGTRVKSVVFNCGWK